MSAYDDVQRFFWIDGNDSEAKELLRELSREYAQLRAIAKPHTSVEAVQYGLKITQLEAELAESTKGLRAVKRELLSAYAEIRTLRCVGSQTGVIATSGGGNGVAMSSTEDMSKPGNQSAATLNVFGDVDPDFIPCRDERCPIDELHPVHKVTGVGRGPRKRKQPTDA